jgi:peptidoglycan hydrolase-like protein with peptidoglycan-binding domain
MGPDVFALQTALAADGEYPPANETANDCPRSGKLGPCTKSAIRSFQNKYKIDDENGVVGPTTMSKLNQLFSL